MSQDPKPPRPSVEDLPSVDGSEFLLRRIPRDGFDHRQPDGLRLTNALFPTDDFKPSDDSYGASAFVESRLPEGFISLTKADSKWDECGVVRVQVRDLEQFNVRVCFTRQDCDYDDEDLQNAHASFIGIETKPNRTRLIRFLQGMVWKVPSNLR